MDVYPLVLPHKVNKFIEGLRMLCLRWLKRKVISGMFRWIGGKNGTYYRTREGAKIVGGWTTGKIR